ncbi:GNAT family N-acetyltransferase [Moorellaceae bacterium AZ2]
MDTVDKSGLVVIEFARPEEAAEIEELLVGAGMGIWGLAEEYVVLREASRPLGCAKLVWTAPDAFHLETLVMGPDGRGRGLGGKFIKELLRRPWAYCRGPRSPAPPVEDTYSVTVVARGGVAGFYRRYGFRDYTFEALPSPYREQCDGCEDFVSCNPVPLRFAGRVR